MKVNMNLFVKFLLNLLMKIKMNFFFTNMNIKEKLNFSSHIKIKFQPRT